MAILRTAHLLGPLESVLVCLPHRVFDVALFKVFYVYSQKFVPAPVERTTLWVALGHRISESKVHYHLNAFLDKCFVNQVSCSVLIYLLEKCIRQFDLDYLVAILFKVAHALLRNLAQAMVKLDERFVDVCKNALSAACIDCKAVPGLHEPLYELQTHFALQFFDNLSLHKVCQQVLKDV